MSYDTKCYELAETFLSDETMPDPVRVRAENDLAQQIQDLIESFIEYDLVELRTEHEADAADFKRDKARDDRLTGDA